MLRLIVSVGLLTLCAGASLSGEPGDVIKGLQERVAVANTAGQLGDVETTLLMRKLAKAESFAIRIKHGRNQCPHCATGHSEGNFEEIISDIEKRLNEVEQ